jgi:hypothetical protein
VYGLKFITPSRDRMKRLERDALGPIVVVEHEDGTTSRFRSKEIFPECFLHETARWRRSYFGEDPGEAHPVVVALRTATNLEALMSEQGTMLGTFLGEDEIMRGVRERPGPQVRERNKTLPGEAKATSSRIPSSPVP